MRKKFGKIIAICLFITILCQLSVFAKEEIINVTINREKIEFDQNPIIISGRTLVPLRKIFESLNAFVEWDDASQSVYAKKGATEISLTIDSNIAKVNGKEILLDVPAKIVNDRTLVPARFVAETLNCNVGWNGDTNTVIINSYKPLADEKNLFSVDKVTYGKYIATNGKVYANPIYNHSELMKVTPGDTIYFTNYRFPTKVRFVTAYDANKKAVAECGSANAVDKYIVPQGIEYIAVTTYEKSDANLKISNSNGIDGFIPEEICVADGKKVTIYANQLVSERKQGLKFDWECKVGKEQNENYLIEAKGNFGSYPLKVTAIDTDGRVVWTGESTVKIVKDELPKMKFLAIGDSLSNNKPWLNLLKEDSDGKIEFLGTRGRNTIFFEGRSGFSSGSYMNATEYTFEKEGVHPFWDGARFNWNYYKTTTGVQPDVVQIFLGINGIQNSPVRNVSNIVRMVDYIKNDDPNIPIFVVNTMYKGPLTDDIEHTKVFNLMERLNNVLSNYKNVYIVPVAVTHDSSSNYSEKDQVHPTQVGFTQVADVIYSSLCAHIK